MKPIHRITYITPTMHKEQRLSMIDLLLCLALGAAMATLVIGAWL